MYGILRFGVIFTPEIAQFALGDLLDTDGVDGRLRRLRQQAQHRRRRPLAAPVPRLCYTGRMEKIHEIPLASLKPATV